MKVIKNYEQFIEEARNIMNTQSGIIRVSSFNIHAPENSATDLLLKDILKADSKIIVGTSYRTCTPDCKACIASNQNRSNKLNTLVESHNIRVYDDLHLKYFARGMKAITGGMNLTGSGFSDMSLLIDDIVVVAEMNKHFDKVYKSFSGNKLYHVAEPVFPFGKYKGDTVKEVAAKDPAYIAWAKTNYNEALKKSLQLV